MTSPHQLEHTSARGDSVVSVDTRGNSIAENGAHFMDPDVIRRTSDTEQVVVPSMYSSNKVIEAVDTDSTEDPEEGAGDRVDTRYRSPGFWTGRCDRRRTFGQFGKGTAMFGRGVSRNP